MESKWGIPVNKLNQGEKLLISCFRIESFKFEIWQLQEIVVLKESKSRKLSNVIKMKLTSRNSPISSLLPCGSSNLLFWLSSFKVNHFSLFVMKVRTPLANGTVYQDDCAQWRSTLVGKFKIPNRFEVLSILLCGSWSYMIIILWFANSAIEAVGSLWTRTELEWNSIQTRTEPSRIRNQSIFQQEMKNCLVDRSVHTMKFM